MRTKLLIKLAFIFVLSAFVNKLKAQDPYIGEIRLFAGNFAPSGWAVCNGQILQISQNQALFSILGTTYGGNGTTTFALPDLRSRIAMGSGQGTGLTNTIIGEMQGLEQVSLLVGNLPAHTHSLNVYNGASTLAVPQANMSNISQVVNADLSQSTLYINSAPNTPLSNAAISPTGSNQPVSIKQPSLTLTYIIALQGIYPSRN